MRAKAWVALGASMTMAAGMLVMTGGPAGASSHREAPLISEDPVADNTDLYIFRDATDSTKVNIIANYIGLEKPDGGPNFAKFGDDVRYEINIDNNGDVATDISYQLRFRTTQSKPTTSFLYNDGVLTTPTDANRLSTQTYTLQRVDSSGTHVLLSDQITPPTNVGIRSTPSYEANLAAPTVGTFAGSGGGRVFAGSRGDAFFVDLGSIFDLLGLRPINGVHAITAPPAAGQAGVDGVKRTNVHTIALQLPISAVTSTGTVPTTVDAKASVIGVYASASRQRVKVLSIAGGAPRNAGRWTQVSRLGIPLVNEVLIPLGEKDLWNGTDPEDDGQFFDSILDPEPTKLLPILYPAVFKAGGVDRVPTGGAASRTDLLQLLTGQLAGLSAANALPPADLLRVNLARAAVAGTTGNRLAALQADPGGFPNGRRLTDDVVDIELQVLAGVLLTGFGNGNPATAVPGGSGATYSQVEDDVDSSFATQLGVFPYMPTPFGGYQQPAPSSTDAP